MLRKHLNRSDIRTLCEMTDIHKLISRDLKLTGTGDNRYSLCPFHEEKSPSFCVVRKKNFYYCFGCGGGGDPLDWLQHRYRRSHYESKRKALTELLNFNNISVKKLKTLSKEKYPNGLGYHSSRTSGLSKKDVVRRNKVDEERRLQWLETTTPEFFRQPVKKQPHVYTYVDDSIHFDDIPF